MEKGRISLATTLRQSAGFEMADLATIYMIDDDPSMRSGLSSLLRSVGYEVFTYDSARAFLHDKLADRASCLLLDVRLPGVNGLDFQSKLAELGILLPVILMTGHGDIPMSVRGMKAGAIDFLTKPIREQDLLDAVAVAIERDGARRAAEAASKALRERYAQLSEREQEVMRLVTLGKMNKQVAGLLNLSEITIKLHRASAMRKMGARTLADLVRIAEELKASRS